MPSGPGKTKFTSGIYPSYFFRDHDPIIDQIMTLRAMVGGPLKPMLDRSGVTYGTFHNWEKRKTKKPQFASASAVVRAMGGEIIVTYNGTEIKRKRFGNGHDKSKSRR